MPKLSQMMLEVNLLAQKNRMKMEVRGHRMNLHSMRTDLPLDVRMFLLSEQPNISEQSKNGFNLPTTDEIAFMFTSKDGDPLAKYDLKVFPKGDN